MSSTRITKQELLDFVKWHLQHLNDEQYKNLGCKRISDMYFKDTGKRICRTTINNNRNCWFYKDNKLIRVN